MLHPKVHENARPVKEENMLVARQVSWNLGASKAVASSPWSSQVMHNNEQTTKDSQKTGEIAQPSSGAHLMIAATLPGHHCAAGTAGRRDDSSSGSSNGSDSRSVTGMDRLDAAHELQIPGLVVAAAMVL
jgi:hypothetical protein